MTTLTDIPQAADERSDAELLHADERASEYAFREFFLRHVDAIRSYARARVDPHSADDVVAETFGAAWRIRARFALDAETARPWLYGIAARQLQRLAAREQQWQVGLLRGATPAGVVELDTEGSPALDPDLTRAVARLPLHEREVLLLVALGELRLTDAADALGISTVAARVRLHRARRKVTTWLTETADGGES